MGGFARRLRMASPLYYIGSRLTERNKERIGRGRKEKKGKKECVPHVAFGS